MAEIRRWAHIKNGIVENVSNWDGDVWRWQPPEDVEMMLCPDHVGRDWRYENGEFLPPISPVEVIE